MKKVVASSLLFIFLLLATFKTAFADVSFLPQFGGRIISTTAFQIAALEMAGFQCAVPGSTISITPIGSPFGTPVEYFIPIGIYSKTGYAIRAGQLIIGKYSRYGGKTAIPCTSPTVPPVITTVWLDTITLFGNSK